MVLHSNRLRCDQFTNSTRLIIADSVLRLLTNGMPKNSLTGQWQGRMIDIENSIVATKL